MKKVVFGLMSAMISFSSLVGQSSSAMNVANQGMKLAELARGSEIEFGGSPIVIPANRAIVHFEQYWELSWGVDGESRDLHTSCHFQSLDVAKEARVIPTGTTFKVTKAGRNEARKNSFVVLALPQPDGRMENKAVLWCDDSEVLYQNHSFDSVRIISSTPASVMDLRIALGKRLVSAKVSTPDSQNFK